jgi:predicted nucleic acid-binding Zn ribbon protein
VVCGKEFHPRHPNSKYCSHECQKALQLKKRTNRTIGK